MVARLRPDAGARRRQGFPRRRHGGAAMKKVGLLTLALSLAAVGFLAGTWSQHRSASGHGAGRTVLRYVDPMHPAYTSDKPGIAPDCGMQLEPVYADDAPAAPTSPGAVSSRPAGTVSISG